MSFCDYEVPTGEDMQPNEYEPIPEGTYHLAVTAVDMQPTSKKGEAKNGVEITFEVQAGTVEGQAGKTFKECFYWPAATNKDGGKFLAKRLGRLGSVLLVARPGMKLGEVPWEEMAARHFIAATHHESFTGNDGKEFVSTKIDGLKMWHVAGAEVAAIPKDAEVLELMPMGGDPFAGGEGGENGNGKGAGNGQPAKPAPTAPKPTSAAAPTAGQGQAQAPAAQGKAADPYANL